VKTDLHLRQLQMPTALRLTAGALQ